MTKLDELAHLLAEPVLPKASSYWAGADVVVAFSPPPDPFWNSYYPRDREVFTEHALELSFFFEFLRDAFYDEGRIDHCSKIEFFGRLANATGACLLEHRDASAHMLCAVVLHEAYAMAKQMDEGAFDYLVLAKGNQIADDLALPGQRTGYSGLKETIKFFLGRGIQIHGTA